LLLLLLFFGFWRAVITVSNSIGLAEDPDPSRVSRGVASGVYHAASDLSGLVAAVVGGAAATALGLENLFRVVPMAAVCVYLVLAVIISRAARAAPVPVEHPRG
jgi:hypothetical protein